MFLVDTNIFAYAANRSAPQHAAARAALASWRAADEGWAATWSIFYEFLRVVTHPGVFVRPLALAEAWRFLEACATGSSFRLLGETERHTEVLRDLIRRYPSVRGNHVHDFHIAALMYEHGVREIRTADADFHRFDFLSVVNPVEVRPPTGKR
ncbi:MAG TPA: TA system VapC family ribonuclease toxin [Terriglobales bacterium]|jgi:hypothetical protein